MAISSSLTYVTESINKIAVLSKEEMSKLLLEVYNKTEDYQSAKDSLMHYNLKLVLMIARRNHRKTRSDVLEDIQDGVIALDRAIDKFNPALGCSFSTYAVNCLTNAMIAKSINRSRLIKIDRQIYYQQKKVMTVVKDVNKNLSIQELSEYTGFSIALLKKIAKIPKNPLSMHAPSIQVSSEDHEYTLESTLKDTDSKSIEDVIFEEQRHTIISKALEHLNNREQFIICSRFGLNNDHKVFTLDELSSILNLSRARVSQIEKSALEKLSTTTVKNKLRDCL